MSITDDDREVLIVMVGEMWRNQIYMGSFDGDEKMLTIVRHRENAIRTQQAEIERLREAGEVLRREATMLCQNAMACAVNHYGEDFALHGMPGWLNDSRTRIETATAALKGPDHD